VNSAEAIAFVGLAFLLAKVLGPIGAAVGARIRGRRRDGAPDHRLASEVDELRTRLAEVEERVDFAERLLAGGRQAEQISGGTDR
jgi:hypothetical protein